MSPDFLLSLEHPDNHMAASIYQYESTGQFRVWVKLGASIVEVKGLDELVELIDLLKETEKEINQIEKGLI